MSRYTAAAWNHVQAFPRGAGEPHVSMLRSVNALRDACDAIQTATVKDMRRHGWSWNEIGEALGVSAQAAHRRYRTVTE